MIYELDLFTVCADLIPAAAARMHAQVFTPASFLENGDLITIIGESYDANVKFSMCRARLARMAISRQTTSQRTTIQHSPLPSVCARDT